MGFTARLWNQTNNADIAVSLSGSERNHLFMSEGGTHFDDVSGLSGLDTPGDSRAFAIFDYDRDGWQDLALVNTNAPFLNLYRNELGRGAARERGRVVGLRFVGGNHASSASKTASNRDAVGSVVTADLGDIRLVREHRFGDGFGVQNSATMLLGIGARDRIERLEVRWPSGKTDHLENVQAGALLTLYEDPETAPGGRAVVEQAYVREAESRIARAETRQRLSLPAVPGAAAAKTFAIYTTTATWCDACKRGLPQLQVLRDAFGTDVALYGVPVDPDDDSEKIAAYVKEYRPAYQILTNLSEVEVERVTQVVIGALDDEVLPASIVTDPGGRILETIDGVPSLSKMRALIRAEL